MNGEDNKKNDVAVVDVGYLFGSALKILKRFWWLFIAIAGIIAGGLFGFWKSTYKPVYSSYCSFTVKVVNESTTGDINTLHGFYFDKDLAEQLDRTFSYILTGDLISDEIRYKIGDSVEMGNVTSRAVKGSNLFVLTAIGDTPEESIELLRAVLEVYDDAARYVVGEILVEMVEQPVMGEAPINGPSFVKAGMIGALVAFFVGISWVTYDFITNRTVRNPEDLENLVNVGCMGLVPEVDGKQKGRTGILISGQSHVAGEFRESIHGICRKVEYGLERCGGKVLLVTGTLPGEGKTTICQSMAYTFAGWGKRVYVVDGDLRKPTLAKRFQIKGKSFDLKAVLDGKRGIESVTEQVEENLFVVANTQPLSEPTVYLDDAFGGLIKDIEGKADIIIVDAPPCDIMSDVMLLQSYSDRVLYIVKQNYVHLKKVASALEELCENDKKLMGYVLNCTEKTSRGYGKYGYGSYSYGKYGNGYYGHYGYYGKGYHKYYEED